MGQRKEESSDKGGDGRGGKRQEGKEGGEGKGEKDREERGREGWGGAENENEGKGAEGKGIGSAMQLGYSTVLCNVHYSYYQKIFEVIFQRPRIDF